MGITKFRVAIQRNPMSGSGRRDHELMEMVQGLKELGLKPYLFSDREKLAHHLQNPQFREDLLCIVAAGGDGTVDDLINRYPGIPLAIFAMGTENLLAKHCGMPQDGRKVAGIIADRYIRTIDLGLAGEHRFAVMASCGFDAEVVMDAHARRKGRITKLHYIRPIAKALWRNHRPLLKLTSDDSVECRECEMVIVSNISRYALNLPVNPRVTDTDGQFEVCMIRKASPLRLIELTLRGLLLGQLNSPNIEHFYCRHLRIDSDEAVAIQADGDPIYKTPCELQILPAALQLLVPQNHATGRLAEISEEVQLLL